MTTETLPLNPLAALALLFPSGFSQVTSPNDPAPTLLEFSPKKPTYGYDENSEDEDDDYDDEDEELDEDDDEESEDDSDDEYSYDDEDDDYDDEEDDEEEDEGDEGEDDEDEDDIGYYTGPLNSTSEARFLRG